MNNIEKLLINLESTNANVRYEACEELRVAKAISKQANDALEKATNDPDPLVADAAQRALLIHNPPTPASQEIQELDNFIGDTKPTAENVSKDGKFRHSGFGVVSFLIGLLSSYIGVSLFINPFSPMMDPSPLMFSVCIPPILGFIFAYVGLSRKDKIFSFLGLGLNGIGLLLMLVSGSQGGP